MNIVLEDPTILGLDKTFNFSDASISLRNVNTVSLDGRLLSLNNKSDVTGIWSQIKYFSTGFDGFITLNINGVDYQNAKLNSINFNQDTNQDVLAKNFNIAFEYYEDGVSGSKDYLTGYFLRDVESISDDFSMDISADKNYSFTHTIDLTFFNKTGSNLINSARTIATGLLANNKYSLTKLGGNKYSDSFKRKYYNETFDVFKGTYSLEETFGYNTDIINNASIATGISIQLGNNGVIKVTEDGEIVGLKEDLYANALSEYNSLIAGSYSRCQGFLNNFSDFAGLTTTLKTQPVEQNTVSDKFLGKINYTMSYSNELKYSDVIKSININIDKDMRGFSKISEQGNYIGYGKKSKNSSSTNTKFKATLDSYATQYQTLYSNNANGLIKVTSVPSTSFLNFGQLTNFYFINSSLNSQITDGSLSFTHQYSNEKTYDEAAKESGFKYIDITVSEDFAVHFTNTYEVPGLGPINGKQLVQSSNQARPGKRNVKVSIVGLNDNISLYEAKFKTLIKQYFNKDATRYTYLENVDYSFDPINKKFEGSASFVFFNDYRERNDFSFKLNKFKY